MIKRCSICFLLLSLAVQLLVLGRPTDAKPPSIPELGRLELSGSSFSVKELLSQNKYYTRYRIAYKSGELTISGIMNLPKGKGPFPVIITNHGYIPPSIYTLGRGLKREQDYFARHGYIVVHPDYRNHAFSDKDPDQQATFNLAYEQDVINCVLAIKNSNKGYFDKEHIGMLGHSRGGGITLNILVSRPDLVKAAVLYAPMSMNAWDNFARWSLGRGRQSSSRTSSARAREGRRRAEEILSLYGSPETNPKFWQELSAETYLGEIKAPVAIFHGTSDDSVPVEWSDKLAEALKKQGKTVFLYRIPAEKHEFIAKWPFFMQKSLELFDQYLK
ncbi:MAG: alpha/beta fold hydrolase [Candidatus Saganbacteria bacterium]|nr:alpha/beta fold hydrolase [Candidatus Saganbacteria bacterium]